MAWMVALFVLLIVMVGLLAYLLSFPKAYTVKRSIVIAKPLHEVFAYVVDLHHWDAWSPWMLQEPTAKTTTTNGAQVGGVHTWDGAKIGAGQMAHQAIVPNERIDILLTFLRPFKSTAKVTWSFQQVSNDATDITWEMQAQMPLPLRPFQGFFAKMIGYDFALGLALLRGQLDPASDHPRITFDGTVERDAQTYTTEHFEGSLADMRGAMKEAYPRLWQSLSKDIDRRDSKPAIAAYHKVKFMKDTTVMDMGLAVKQLNAGETGLVLPAGKYFQMTLRGSYDFLPSSWNTLYGQIKMQKLKIDKHRPALEEYAVSPMEAAHTNDWVTHLCVPIR